MKRTIKNCRLIKRMSRVLGEPEREDNKCLGYVGDDDEPCEVCKVCKLNTSYEEEVCDE